MVAALGLVETPGVEPADALTSYFGGREMLLVLDNLEHLLDDAPLLAHLLAGSPSLQLLVTSREPLRLKAEHEYPVPPLVDDEAVQLFLDRARAVKRDFSGNGEVVQICRRLDSLPLAIELAAARVRSLSARELLDRLASRLPLLVDGPRDAPERQQTLRATIDWSRRLLPPAEQRLFVRLGVFADGWTLEAAGVCDTGAGELASLVEKSLLRAGDNRWWMLETVREYAAEALALSGEADEICRRHADHFIALAERAAPKLRRGTEDLVWLDLLDAERANLRAALTWLIERADGDAAQRLVHALFHFWHDRGPTREAFEWYERALALPSPPSRRAAALCHGSVFAAWASEHMLSRAWAEEGLPLARAGGDHLSVVAALQILGFHRRREDLEEGAALLEEAVSVARASGDQWALGITLFTLLNCFAVDDPSRANELGAEAAALDDVSITLRGMIAGARAEIAESQGDLDRAVELTHESLALRRQAGADTEFLPLSSLGWLALLQGDAAGGWRLLLESLHGARETGARDRVAMILMFLAAAAAARGLPLEAATLHGTVSNYHETVAIVPGWDEFRESVNGFLDRARGQVGEKAWAAAVERGRSMTLDEATRYAEAVTG
jgi:predicted ATPase